MDEPTNAPLRSLEPLGYHKGLIRYLQDFEPAVWEWSRSTAVRQRQDDDVRETMLRQTYRLETGSHPQIYEACNASMIRLGIDAPVTLYQANDGAMNASLCYIPGEVHLVFYGPILERLEERELLALMGHELAHYRLWSADEGAHLAVSQVFDHALSYPGATPSHRETARLLSLYTELYADRGAALAAGEVTPAVSMLVKVMTGLNSVDPAAYLRQAEELEKTDARSEGGTHPEAFLRARALDLWWRGDTMLEAWVGRRIRGPLSIEGLDLLRQEELTGLTRKFFARFLQQVEVQSEGVLTQVRSYFPDFQPGEAALDYAAIGPATIDDPTRDYFIALMFDCAMADPDVRDMVMQAAAKAAEAIGATDLLKVALRRDLKWIKRDIDKLIAQAAKAA